MPKKRDRVGVSPAYGARKTRVAWSRLDCLKSNPDRASRSPVATLTQRDVAVCRPLLGWGMLIGY